MSSLRFKVVGEAFRKKALEVETPADRPSVYFAKYVFNKQKMFKYLPAKVYAKMCDVIDNGAPLDRSVADEVAAGMKKWAMDLGVTHYTHWFLPLTEGTAEKHDGFVEHDGKDDLPSGVIPTEARGLPVSIVGVAQFLLPHDDGGLREIQPDHFAGEKIFFDPVQRRKGPRVAPVAGHVEFELTSGG